MRSLILSLGLASVCRSSLSPGSCVSSKFMGKSRVTGPLRLHKAHRERAKLLSPGTFSVTGPVLVGGKGLSLSSCSSSFRGRMDLQNTAYLMFKIIR
jgi:hypothetical protein